MCDIYYKIDFRLNPCCAFIDGQCERRLQTNGELKSHLRRWEILPIPVIEEGHKTFFTQCHRSFQGIHVGAGYAGWHQLGRGFRCAHGNRCDSWFHQTPPVAIENTQNFRHLTNSHLKILVSKLFISTGEVLRYANVVLPHSPCVIFLSSRAVVQCEDSDLRSPEDLPCTSPSLCCLYNAGSRAPSCIFDFVCKAVRLGFSFTKASFQVSVSPQVLNVITGQEGRTAVEQC